MSSQDLSTPQETDTDAHSDSPPTDDHTAQVELLREENRRLRARYAHTRRTEYRRAALGVGVLGVVAALGGLALPATRATLFALAGIGLFTAVLTYFLTPERFVAASVGERTYAARAALGAALVADLGLQDTRLYVPTAAATSDDAAPVTLFVPQHVNYTIPDADELATPVVVPSDAHARGVALPPTGGGLYREFEATMTDSTPTAPGALAAQLTDALVEGFELVDDAVVDDQAADGRLMIGIRGSTFGAIDRFDHPVESFLATGLALELDTPVSVDTTATDDDRFDYRVTVRWDDSAGDPAA